MEIVWDDVKRQANLEKHGLDFAELDEAFFAEALTGPVKLGRLGAVGRLNGRPIMVVFVRLGTEAVSVISMRPASLSERKLL
jgi:uncharacterized protein